MLLAFVEKKAPCMRLKRSIQGGSIEMGPQG